MAEENSRNTFSRYTEMKLREVTDIINNLPVPDRHNSSTRGPVSRVTNYQLTNPLRRSLFWQRRHQNVPDYEYNYSELNTPTTHQITVETYRRNRSVTRTFQSLDILLPSVEPIDLLELMFEDPESPENVQGDHIRKDENCDLSCSFTELKRKESCAICKDSIKKGQKVPKLNCGHAYHTDCLSKSVKYSKKCPVCRINIENVIIKKNV